MQMPTGMRALSGVPAIAVQTDGLPRLILDHPPSEETLSGGGRATWCRARGVVPRSLSGAGGLTRHTDAKQTVHTGISRTRCDPRLRWYVQRTHLSVLWCAESR